MNQRQTIGALDKAGYAASPHPSQLTSLEPRSKHGRCAVVLLQPRSVQPAVVASAQARWCGLRFGIQAMFACPAWHKLSTL